MFIIQVQQILPVGREHAGEAAPATGGPSVRAPSLTRGGPQALTRSCASAGGSEPDSKLNWVFSTISPATPSIFATIVAADLTLDLYADIA
jgi:hypothetical protein